MKNSLLIILVFTSGIVMFCSNGAAVTVNEPEINNTPLPVSETGRVSVNVSGSDIDQVLINLTDAGSNLEFEDQQMSNNTNIASEYYFDFKPDRNKSSIGSWTADVTANDTSSNTSSNSSSFTVSDDIKPVHKDSSLSKSAVDLLKDDPSNNITTEFVDNETGISQIYLETNETGFFENYTLEYQKTFSDKSVKRNTSILWDNDANNISSPRTIAVRIWAKDDSSNSTDGHSQLLYFRTKEHPVVRDLKASDVKAGKPSKITVKALDVARRVDINNVTLTVENPDNEEITLNMERVGNITEGRFSGYKYRLYFDETRNPGRYHVEVKVSDDSGSDTSTTSFRSEGGLIPTIEGVRLNPFYLGQNTVAEGYSLILSVPLALQIFGGTLLLVGFLTLAVYWGDRYEETDFRPPEQRKGGNNV